VGLRDGSLWGRAQLKFTTNYLIKKMVKGEDIFIKTGYYCDPSVIYIASPREQCQMAPYAQHFHRHLNLVPSSTSDSSLKSNRIIHCLQIELSAHTDEILLLADGFARQAVNEFGRALNCPVSVSSQLQWRIFYNGFQ
jgi:hypothetical protein